MNSPRDDGRPDRRTARTRTGLADALVSLVLEKGYEAVTVQDILDRANVGRSTFYTHFKSKEELLFSGHGWLTEQLFAEPNDPEDETLGVNLSALFHHADAHYRLAKALLGKGSGELIVGHLRDLLYLRIRQRVKARLLPGPDVELRAGMTGRALAAMLIGVLHWWLDQEMPLPPERMAELTRTLMEKGAGVPEQSG